MNCGYRIKKNILPTKHSVLGILPKVNRNADCCEDPGYEDVMGFHQRSKRKSVRSFVASFA